MGGLTHSDEHGKASMVDVGSKGMTARRALAAGAVLMNESTCFLLERNRIEKGDALGVARVAGIQAGKRTSDLVPLCHNVPLDNLEIELTVDREARQVEVVAACSARWTTGVEMEAMVAVSAACLALYDMVKSVDRTATISNIRLLEKSGGRSGEWKRQE